jgi:ankyrin repeat and IBR domain-containing protein 1
MVDLFKCNICLNELEINEKHIILFCEHKFCKICFKEYLTRKIDEGNANEILCPGYECYLFIEHSTIEDSVSPQVARKYLRFGLKSFVDTNPLIKWCPNANCGLAAKNPFSNNEHENLCSRSIECSCGHYYCWTCLQEGHEPVNCQQWKQWLEKIQLMQPRDSRLDELREKEETSANNLWLIANSKKCPNCNTSIEKNEGCNHVKCIKVKRLLFHHLMMK